MLQRNRRIVLFIVRVVMHDLLVVWQARKVNMRGKKYVLG